MTEQEAIRAFGENCKWLRKRIRELEAKLRIRDAEQERFDREDEEVFRIVRGQKSPMSAGCIHIRIR